MVNSFAELIKIALHPKEYVLTKDDVDYLDRPPSQFLKDAGIYDTRKIDKISTETLMGAYRDVAITYKKHGAHIPPQSADAYLRFLGKVELFLKIDRHVPNWKLLALFKKESNYKRWY